MIHHMRLLRVALHVFIVGLFTSIACHNDPIPVNPEPGAPCGRYYHQCPKTGGCCGPEERCGIEGHACGLGDCCFTGETVGGARKSRKQLSPDEARGMRP